MRVAILIDGDNVSPAHAEVIAALARTEGKIDLHRVYTDATRPSGWHDARGARVIHAGTGKNAADLLLAIDAMDHCLPGAFDTLVLASSDGDFAHLAIRLRERGLTVIGAGESKAPKGFRDSCTRFVALDQKVPKSAPATCATPFDHNIRSVIAEHSRNGAGIRLTELAPRMHTRYGIRISTFPERSWRAYLTARADLFDLDPRGPDAHVRFRPEGFTV